MSAYPLTFPNEGDARFTGGLLDEIANVLTAHGFPPAGDDETDWAVLRSAVALFLYGSTASNADDIVMWPDVAGWDDREGAS
jgi:hypothetical protein